jgi:hypothetical protein
MSTKNYTHISLSGFFTPDSRFCVPHLWSADKGQSFVVREISFPAGMLELIS